MTVTDMISYRHKDDHQNKTRFVQYRKDKVPSWAVDVQPHIPPSAQSGVSDKPKMVWIEDERPESGICHVHNEWSEGAETYGTPYARAALDEAEARAVKAEAERDAANALLREAFDAGSDHGWDQAKQDECGGTEPLTPDEAFAAFLDAHLGAKP